MVKCCRIIFKPAIGRPCVLALVDSGIVPPITCDCLRVAGASICLYRDVWIAAIASSRTSLATLMGVMCNTSQCELRSLRVNSGMLNVIRIVTYYTLPR